MVLFETCQWCMHVPGGVHVFQVALCLIVFLLSLNEGLLLDPILSPTKNHPSNIGKKFLKMQEPFGLENH